MKDILRMNLNFKNDRVIITLESETIEKGKKDVVVIPSRLYPLSGVGCYASFNSEATLPIDDPEIEAVFNSIAPDVGACYKNVVTLYDALKEQGLEKGVKTFVGWLFVNEGVPIHHTWLVLDDAKILDLTDGELVAQTEEGLANKAKYKPHDPASMREVSVRTTQERHLKYSNAENCTFGKEKWGRFYIGRECDIELGIQTRLRLQEEYPYHPTFAEFRNANGQLMSKTETQKLLIKGAKK